MLNFRNSSKLSRKWKIKNTWSQPNHFWTITCIKANLAKQAKIWKKIMSSNCDAKNYYGRNFEKDLVLMTNMNILYGLSSEFIKRWNRLLVIKFLKIKALILEKWNFRWPWKSKWKITGYVDQKCVKTVKFPYSVWQTKIDFVWIYWNTA